MSSKSKNLELFPGQEMGAYSDDESQSCKKPRSSETNASSEMHLPVHSSNAGMRFDAQEPCVLFSKGKCTYGERCRYAHVIGNVRETEAQRGHWAVNQRRTERINFCQYFVSGRPCPYGNKCRFLHETGGNKANSGLGMSRKSSAICIVTNNDGGKSKKLSNDPQDHQNAVWLKTRLCAKWEKMGSCAYGSNCNFAHGNAELRRVDCPNSLDSSRGHALDTESKNAASWMPESGIVHQQREHCKAFVFKWTDIKKISQVYADWIDNVPLIPVASGKVGN